MSEEQQLVYTLVGALLRIRVTSVTRVLKGRTNRVYRVKCDGRNFACRFNDAGRTLKSYERNSMRLKQLGVKTAEIVLSDYEGQTFGVPFQLVEWVKGRELDDVVAGGSDRDIESFAIAVAEAIAKIQLWEGTGYGYQTSAEWNACDNWLDVVVSSIQRAKTALGLVRGAEEVVDALVQFAESNRNEIAVIPRRAYIDDWYHQNVFLSGEDLIGIDVDSVAFGDVRDLLGRSLWRFWDEPKGRLYVNHLLGRLPGDSKESFVIFYAVLFGCYAPEFRSNLDAKMNALLELSCELRVGARSVL